MGQLKKNIWGVLGLIAVVSGILAYVAADDSVLAALTSTEPDAARPVILQAELVQDKVLKGSDGKVAVSLTLAGANIERQAPVQVQHADLVIVLDRSGSMQGRKIDDARQAVMRLVDRLTVNDRLSLVTYSNGVDTVFPLRFMDDVPSPASQVGR